METHYFDAPCGITFKLVLSRSTYSIAITDHTGGRVAWTGRSYGPSLTDALNMACYTGNPLRAAAGMWFNFKRIDYYVDGPGLLDLWAASEYRGDDSKSRAAVERQRRIDILRHVCRYDYPIHVDAKRGIERDAAAPAGTIDRMIAAGELQETTNRHGQPAFEIGRPRLPDSMRDSVRRRPCFGVAL